MTKACIRAAFIFMAVAGTGCAFTQPSVRPAYTYIDTVSQIEAAQLIGSWKATELNPVPGTEPQSTTIQYNEDGTVISTVEFQHDSETDDIAFALNGQWSINEDVVTHFNVQMSNLDDSEVGSILSQLINDQTAAGEQNGIFGEATVVEASANRLVMVGADGVAVEYVRQPTS